MAQNTQHPSAQMKSLSSAFSSVDAAQGPSKQPLGYPPPPSLQYPLMQSSNDASYPEFSQVYSMQSPRYPPPPSIQYPPIQSSQGANYPPGPHRKTFP
jgi:hypothetical protein